MFFNTFSLLFQIPIFLGAGESLLPSHDMDKKPLFHGKDGFGDVLPQDEDLDVQEMVEGEHAVAAINQFCIEVRKGLRKAYFFFEF